MTLEAEREIMVKEIHKQREEILRAFIAKFGCDPDEIEEITVFGPDYCKVTWRKKETK